MEIGVRVDFPAGRRCWWRPFGLADVAALDYALCNAGKVDPEKTGHARKRCKTDFGILAFACMRGCRRSPEAAVGKNRL